MRKVNIVNLTNDEVRIEPGKSSSEAGKMAFTALEQAVKDIKSGKVDVLVTAPLNKSNARLQNRAWTRVALVFVTSSH